MNDDAQVLLDQLRHAPDWRDLGAKALQDNVEFVRQLKTKCAQHPRELFALVGALEQGIPAELEDSGAIASGIADFFFTLRVVDPLDTEVELVESSTSGELATELEKANPDFAVIKKHRGLHRTLRQRLVDRLGITGEAATWALASWAFALESRPEPAVAVHNCSGAATSPSTPELSWRTILLDHLKGLMIGAWSFGIGVGVLGAIIIGIYHYFSGSSAAWAYLPLCGLGAAILGGAIGTIGGGRIFDETGPTPIRTRTEAIRRGAVAVAMSVLSALTVASCLYSFPELHSKLMKPPSAGTSEVAKSSIEKLGDDDPDVRHKGIAEIANRYPTNAEQEAIVRLATDVTVTDLASPKSETRKKAIRALGDISSKKSGLVPELEKLIKDPTPWVRAEAVRTLVQVGQKSGRLYVSDPLLDQVIDEAASLPALESLPLILKFHNSSSDSIRAKVAKQLERLGPADKDAVPMLMNELWRGGAVTPLEKALARIGPAALPFLEESIRKEPTRRGIVYKAIGTLNLDAKVTVPILTKMLTQETESYHRTTLVAALAGIGPGARAALPEVLDAAAKESNSTYAYVTFIAALGPDAIPSVLDGLSHDNAKVRRVAAEGVGKMRPVSDAVVRALMPLLDDKDPNIRQAACSGLGSCEEHAKIAIPAMERRLLDTDAAVQIASAEAVWRITKRTDKAVPVLIRQLAKSSQGHVAGNARTVLRHIANALAKNAAAAQPALKDVISALELAEMNYEGEDRAEWIDCLVVMGPQAVTDLVGIVSSHPNASVRKAISQALGRIRPTEEITVQALTRLLEDKDEGVRRTACRAIGDLKESGKPALQAVEKLLADNNNAVQMQAASTYWELSRSSTDKVLAILLRQFRGSSDSQELLAHLTLASMAKTDARIVKVLIPLLASESVSERRNAVKLLIQLDSGPSCLTCMEDEDPRIRASVAHWFANNTSDNLQSLGVLLESMGDESYEVADASCRALGRLIGKNERRSLVIFALGSKSKLLRQHAARLMGLPYTSWIGTFARKNEFGEKETYTELSQIIAGAWELQSLSPGPSPATLAALAQHQAEEYVPHSEFGYDGVAVTVPFLVKRMKETSPSVRQMAAAGLALAGVADHQVVVALTEALNDENWPVKIQAAEALGRLGKNHEKAAALLSVGLTHEKDYIRLLAAQSLVTLGSDGKPAAPNLRRALSDSAWPIRAAAARAIANLGEKDEPELLKLLQDDEVRVRREAVTALAKLRVSPDVLIRNLDTRDLALRLRVLRALMQQGTKAATAEAAIRGCMKDDNGLVRIVAAGCHWQITGRTDDAIRIAVEGIERRASSHQRALATRLLERLFADAKSEKILLALQTMARETEREKDRDPSLKVSTGGGRIPLGINNEGAEVFDFAPSGAAFVSEARSVIRRALISQGEAAVPQLIHCLGNPDVSKETYDVLNGMVDKASVGVPELIRHLRNPTTRGMASELLGRIGGKAKEAVPELIPHLRSPDQERRALVLASQFVGQADFPGLVLHVGVWQAHQNDVSNERAPVLKALESFGSSSQPAVPDLMAMLSSPAYASQHGQIVRVLKSIGPPAKPASPALMALLASQTHSSHHWEIVLALEATGITTEAPEGPMLAKLYETRSVRDHWNTARADDILRKWRTEFSNPKRQMRALTAYEAAASLRSKDKVFMQDWTELLIKAKHFGKAKEVCEKVLVLDEKDAASWNRLAWLLSTCPDETIRNGQSSLLYAKRACELTQWKNASCVATLAACYAELRDFAKARELQARALDHPDLGFASTAEVGNARQQLHKYRQDQPWREP